MHTLIQNNPYPDRQWYALYTRSRHEKRVNEQLQDKHIESYLPMKKTIRQWSDRKKRIDEPLFRCYVFIHTSNQERLRALQTYGSVRIIGFNNKPAVIPDSEILLIKQILNEMPDVESCDPLHIGDRVEIMRGPITGVRGRLEQIRNGQRVVVSIDHIGRAVRFNINRSDIRVVTLN